MKTALLFPFLLLFLLSTLSYGQQGCDMNPGSLSNATFCTFPCDGTFFYGQTFGYTPGPNNGWCGSIENDQYLAFIASGTTVEWLAEVDLSCPPSSGGLQFAIYNFDDMLIGSCIGSGAGPGFMGPLVASGLVCGEAYVLRIDGYAGAFCEFKLTPVRGVSGTVPTKPSPITGPSRICPDNTPKRFQFPTSGVCVQNFYIWTVDAGSYPEGNIIIDPPTATTSGTDHPWIDITFLDLSTGLLPGQCVNINISARAFNLCGDSPESGIFQVQYCEPMPQVYFDTVCVGGSINFRNISYTANDAQNGPIVLPAFLDPNAGIGTSACSRIDTLKLTVGSRQSTVEAITLCPSEAFTLCSNPQPPFDPNLSFQTITCTEGTNSDSCIYTRTYNITRIVPAASFSHSIATGNTVNFSSLTNLVSSVLWDFGDGNTSTDPNPTHTYAAAGTYNVTFSAFSACGTLTSTFRVVLQPNGLNDLPPGASVIVFPNPTPAHTNLKITGLPPQTLSIEVIDVLGRQLYQEQVSIGSAFQQNLPAESWDSGLYIVRLRGPELDYALRFFKI